MKPRIFRIGIKTFSTISKNKMKGKQTRTNSGLSEILMQRIKVSDIAKQVRGVSYKPSDVHEDINENSVILLRANNISDGTINFDDVVYVDKSKVSKDQYLQRGDILVCASSGSKSLVGKAASVTFDTPCTFGAFCKVVRPNEKYVDYLGIFFQSDIYRRRISELALGANINNIRNEHIDSMDLPLYNDDLTHTFVKTISILQSIITHRKQQLLKLDELVKARFVEMFGDPVSNNMNWDTQSVESVCSDIYGGGTPSKAHPEYYENGDIPWVSSKDMKTDIITESQIYINHLGVENSTAKMVPVNSVIMVIRSGILKHTLPVAINAVPITVNQDLKVFLPNKCITAIFLSTLFKILEKDILSGVRAVTADNIEFNSLKQRQIIVPPLDLQKQFTAFIKQLNKSKVVVQKALDEAQLLFDSLMQEYFG